LPGKSAIVSRAVEPLLNASAASSPVVIDELSSVPPCSQLESTPALYPASTQLPELWAHDSPKTSPATLTDPIPLQLPLSFESIASPSTSAASPENVDASAVSDTSVQNPTAP